jgi:hypothetical protein
MALNAFLSGKESDSGLFGCCFVILFMYLRYPVITIGMRVDAIGDDDER